MVGQRNRADPMDQPPSSQPANREFVFRTIQLLMVGDIVIGVVLALLGWRVWNMPALAIAGIFLACMGAALAVIMRTLARAAAARQGTPARRQSPHQLRR